ncbi:LuxR C-terminal-related transcriptional regulator [Streptomyces sp. NPDC058623]|uniref:LuxR C-terminal-related transcriptional regulator n=1 Tax=Streptomyces sp. NPDC058623 TaxID=3346563 RepID=UPI0036474350
MCDRGLEYYAAALADEDPQGQCPECLILLGLLRVGGDGALVPMPPELAVSDIARPLELAIQQKQRTLTGIQASMAQVAEVYRDVQQRTAPPVRTILGAEAISLTLVSAADSCQEELLTAQPNGGRSQALLEKALKSDLALNQRGVAQRTIYQHAVRSHGPTMSYVERVSEAGAEVRTLDEVFDRLIVCDRRIAFVPDPAQERRSVALAIEHPGIIRYLVGLFEHAWQRAEPLEHLPSQHRPTLFTDETRKTVLRLMVNGYTDDAIAARLGVSTRTIATHVKKASELLGSRSRAQLAYLIAQTGVLDADGL